MSSSHLETESPLMKACYAVVMTEAKHGAQGTRIKQGTRSRCLKVCNWKVNAGSKEVVLFLIKWHFIVVKNHKTLSSILEPSTCHRTLGTSLYFHLVILLFRRREIGPNKSISPRG